ncbi:MAG: FAD-binding oxidoreductase [Paracoccus sp. (in: a-proteobacteria)]|nr:FAD-binding oxidoreductase [Paracoccus sp. (in: a-proteobacteria)]
MLADDQHRNLWEASAAPPPACAALSGDLSTETVVIGAGYTGLSCALHLALAGRDVAVLEARGIGHGGSGRNVGLVNAGMWVMPERLIETQGDHWGRLLIDALGGGPAEVFSLIERFGMECEPVRRGTLHLGVGRAGWRELGERARQWQALGAPVRRLGPDETRQLVGTDAYAGALLDERAGTINPLGYARGLASAAIASGAQIFTQSPVISAHYRDNLWHIRTSSGQVRARFVVVATNAYSGLIEGFPFAAQQAELTLLPYFQCATAPLSSNIAAQILPERQGCWDTRGVMRSIRMDAAGRLIFGSVGALDGLSAKAQMGFARRAIAQLFPFITNVELSYFWHGQIGMTDNALPKFHRYGPNAIGVNGFNGRGIAPGTVFGRAMAEHIAEGREMILPESPIKVAPMARLKTSFYKAGSHLAHLGAARI